MPGPVFASAAFLFIEIVPGMVKGGHKFHAAFTYGLSYLAGNIPPGTFVFCIPRSKLAGPHGKSIVVLGNRPGKTGARFKKEIGPLIGIELFRLELRYKVVVAELSGFAVDFH